MKGILLKVEEQSSWVPFIGESEPKNIISKGHEKFTHHFETLAKNKPCEENCKERKSESFQLSLTQKRKFDQA